MADRLVSTAGAERVLFGSDLSWNPVAWGLGPLLFARMPLEAKRRVLGYNVRRLMAEQ
jgi:predicted TIM-barrel fold metal-dependent hydrolase